jgi:CRISPR-associated protein Cas5d
MPETKPFRVRARGPMACFTRPEMKVERVSSEVMTPSAARGLLEAVLWKPAIRWRIHEIAVLAPIAWISFRRNEVNSRASPKTTLYLADEDRAQRNTVALRDVDYAITASFEMTEQAGPTDNVRKFEEMFERRLEKGQRFHQPYLGCREFAADVLPLEGPVKPIDREVDRPLGLMFYDFVYGRDGQQTRPLFFEARLKDGVLHVPPLAEVLALNGPEVTP